MKPEKILFVNACVRPDSRTYELAKCLVDNLAGDVCELKLYEENIKPLDLNLIECRELNQKAGNFDHPVFKYAKQLADADTVVLAAPYWDMLFPAVVRTYLESTTAVGVTFAYSEHGVPYGLCKAKRLFYVTTAGGYIGDLNFGFEYVKAVAQGFYGIQDVQLISAEGLDIAGADVSKIMAEAKEGCAGVRPEA